MTGGKYQKTPVQRAGGPIIGKRGREDDDRDFNESFDQYDVTQKRPARPGSSESIRRDRSPPRSREYSRERSPPPRDRRDREYSTRDRSPRRGDRDTKRSAGRRR